MTSTYQFFCQSLHTTSAEECLARVKAEYDTIRPLYAHQCSSAKLWQWTLPGAYEQAIKYSMDLVIAHDVVEAYIDPLVFASKCGLPKAIPFDFIVDIREAADMWIESGLKLKSEYAAAVPQELKELIFARSINIDAAVRSLDASVNSAWQTIMWAEEAARAHLASKPTFDFVVKTVQMKHTLEMHGVLSSMCKHNMLTLVSLGESKESDTLHLISEFNTGWKCMHCTV
jgi:hypothetical protein